MAQSLIAKPVEPALNNAAPNVVRWLKWDGYTYASIQSPDGTWFTTQDPRRTGGQKINPMTWDDLLAKIGERNWSTLELLS